MTLHAEQMRSFYKKAIKIIIALLAVILALFLVGLNKEVPEVNIQKEADIA